MPNEIENTSTALILYALTAIFFIISLFLKKRLLIYSSALSVIILFLYLSSLPDLAVYYDYFNGLD